MRHDILADAFCMIKNAENRGKRICIVPGSNMIRQILQIMKDNEYISKFDFIEDGRGGRFKIELKGRINKCNIIRPRFEVKNDDFIRWEKRYLPSVNVGLLFLTTSKGVIDHSKAKKEKIGGSLLGYIY